MRHTRSAGRGAVAAPYLGEHALVVGASVAGLLAARVLSEFYARVTVLDRDALPGGIAEHRRAVPQDRQIHGMQPAGQLALEELFGGFCAQARAAGAPPLAFGLQMRFRLGGHLLARVDLPGEYCLTSRVLLESLVRRRVRELSNVTLREHCTVLGLVARGSRVVGVRARDGRAHRRARDGVPGAPEQTLRAASGAAEQTLRAASGAAEQTLRADLVVAASGRGGRVPAWLDELGYPRPAEERVQVDVLYASRYLRVRTGALGGDRVVLDDAHPGRPRGLSAQSVEGDRWIVTLSGYGHEHHPPTDDAGWMAFLATVSDAEVLAAFQEAEPLGDVHAHAFPAAVRRRYDRLARFPHGLLVVGDALCNLNPLYGQGMSVAALEAVALQRTLCRGDRKLAMRYFAATRAPVEQAWKLATDADRALPELGLHMSLVDRVLDRYVGHLIAAAVHDPALARLVYDVTGMLEPPNRLLSPSATPRVLRGYARSATRRATPASSAA